MAWEIDLHDEVRAWIVELAESDTKSAELVQKAIDHLGYEGPMAGRSLVDRIKGGKFQNMKKLRPASTGRTEIRMLFAFDPVREAIMPVAGNESGRWESRPRQAIPIADAISRNVCRRRRRRAAMVEYSTWEEAKAQMRAVDPRSDAERAADKEAANTRHEAYVRGHQLSEMRKAAQLTQAELASRLGVTQARVSKIESGEVSGIDIVRSYVTALGGEVVLTATVGDKTWKVA